MARADMRRAETAGRKTPILRRHCGSSPNTTFESSCGFHGSGKLLPVGHHRRKLRVWFTQHVTKHLADGVS